MARRPALFLVAGLAVGLVAGLAGLRLLGGTPMPAPNPSPPAPPVVGADVPPAPAAEPASLADIQRLASDFAQTLALYRLAGQLGAAGVERLLDEADAIGQPSERDAATSILYARYADLDPAAALRHVQARDDLPPEMRAEIAARLRPPETVSDMMARFSRWRILPDDPAGVWRQALAQNTGQQRMNDLALTAILWAKTDPHAAFAAIEAADGVGQEMRIVLRSSVITSWTEYEPTAALAWAVARPDPQSRSRMVEAALGRLAASDPRAAAAWLSGHDNRATVREALAAVASRYAARHAAEAIAWAAALPGDEASEAMSHIFFDLSRDAPERAAELLAGIEGGPARRAAEETLARHWAYSDPEAVAAWLDGLDDSERREALYARLLEEWTGDDVDGASRYLDRLADGQTRERVAWRLFRNAMRAGDIPVAESIFEHLQAGDIRDQAAELLYEQLWDADPARAARYR